MPVNGAADFANESSRLTEKKPSTTTFIENAADYVDALTRPRAQDSVMHKKIIAGRRMRDKYRMEGVVVTEVVKKIA